MTRLLVWAESVVLLILASFAFYGTVASSFAILLLGVALTEVWQSAKDWWVQRKQSITGDYKTLTTGTTPRDDTEPEDNKKLVRRLRIGQRGLRIGGEEETEGKKTKWRILGEVYGEFVVGTWEQISPPATANKGAFHLQCDPADRDHFNGQWIGWVAGKGALGYGEWEWIRLPRKALLRRLIERSPSVPRR